MYSNPDILHKWKIDVIIPVLNEENSIALVINDIPKNLVRTIYVCDNGSTDKSREKALEAGAQVLIETNKGYGSACLKGLRYIQQTTNLDHPDIIVFLDGDYSDRASELPRMIHELVRNDLDLVIGSRVLGRAEKGSLTIQQRFGNSLFTILIKLLFHYKYTDLGPFRAIRYSRLIEMNMEDKDYGWTCEMQVKAAKMKMRVGEIPVSYRKRIGKSKISGTLRGIFGAASKIFYMIFKTYVKG